MAEAREIDTAELAGEAVPATASSAVLAQSSESKVPAGPVLERDAIVRSLQLQLGTDIDPAVLTAEVDAAISRYPSARVTQFLPILIENRVRGRLRRPQSTEGR